MIQNAIRLYPNYSTWSKCLASNPNDILERNGSEIVSDFKVYNNYHAVFIVGAFPKEQQAAAQKSSLVSLWTKHAIAWKILQPSKPTDRTCWKSTEHFSTLPYGWIPDDGAEFFALFIRKLKENWLDLFATAQERLSQRVSTKSRSIINMSFANHTVLL
jgi:hypothetical protein